MSLSFKAEFITSKTSSWCNTTYDSVKREVNENDKYTFTVSPKHQVTIKRPHITYHIDPAKSETHPRLALCHCLPLTATRTPTNNFGLTSRANANIKTHPLLHQLFSGRKTAKMSSNRFSVPAPPQKKDIKKVNHCCRVSHNPILSQLSGDLSLLKKK